MDFSTPPLTNASAPTAHTAPEGPGATARRLNQQADSDKTTTTTRAESSSPPSGILKSRGSPPTSSSSPRTNVSVRFNPEAPMFYGGAEQGGGGGQDKKRRPQAMPHKSTMGVERPHLPSLPQRGWTYAGPTQGASAPQSCGGGPSDGGSGVDEADLSKMVSRILNIKAKERRRLDAGHTPRLVLSPGVVHGDSTAPDYLAAGGHDAVDEGESTSESEAEHELEEGVVMDEDKALTGPLMLESDGGDGDFLKGVVDRLEAVEREQKEEARFTGR